MYFRKNPAHENINFLFSEPFSVEINSPSGGEGGACFKKDVNSSSLLGLKKIKAAVHPWYSQTPSSVLIWKHYVFASSSLSSPDHWQFNPVFLTTLMSSSDQIKYRILGDLHLVSWVTPLWMLLALVRVKVGLCWTLLHIQMSGTPCLCVVGAVVGASVSTALLARSNCPILSSNYFSQRFLQSLSSVDVQPQ